MQLSIMGMPALTSLYIQNIIPKLFVARLSQSPSEQCMMKRRRAARIESRRAFSAPLLNLPDLRSAIDPCELTAAASEGSCSCQPLIHLQQRLPELRKVQLPHERLSTRLVCSTQATSEVCTPEFCCELQSCTSELHVRIAL